MAIDVGAILARAYQTVLHNRVLWVLGALIALLSGTGNSNINYQTGPNERMRIFNLDVAMTPGLIVTLVVVALLLVVVLFVLRALFDAALIDAGDRSARATPPTLREAWQAGKAGLIPVLLLNLILAAFVILLVLGVALFLGLAVGLTVLVAAAGGQVAGQVPEVLRVLPAVGVGLVAVLVLLVVAIPVGFLLAVTTQLAQRAAVLDHAPIGTAWRSGWRLARANPGSAVLVVLAQFVVNLLAGIVVAAILIPLVGIPVVALAVNGAQIDWALGALLVLLVLVAWLLSSAALALPTAWSSVVWTLLYRAETVSVPQAPGAAILGGRMPPLQGGYLH